MLEPVKPWKVPLKKKEFSYQSMSKIHVKVENTNEIVSRLGFAYYLLRILSLLMRLVASIPNVSSNHLEKLPKINNVNDACKCDDLILLNVLDALHSFSPLW